MAWRMEELAANPATAHTVKETTDSHKLNNWIFLNFLSWDTFCPKSFKKRFTYFMCLSVFQPYACLVPT